MKKLFYILILLAEIANAQIVTIPDNSFKLKLLEANTNNHIAHGNGGYIKIDANNDGEIQISEAQSIDSLDVNFSGIYDMIGISSFSNLKKLNCTSNQLTELDLSSLIGLEFLYCGVNQLETLNLNGLANLKFIECSYNNLTSLNLTSLTNLEYLRCEINVLTSLNVQGLSHLETLDCFDNKLPDVNFTGLVNLKFLRCNENLLGNINLNGLTNLQTVDCSGNQLESIDATGLNNLTEVICYSNQLLNLNLTGLSNLMRLNCDFNQLEELNLTGLSGLKYLYCELNQLAALDLTGSTQLVSLVCSDNQLTSLNVNGLVSVNYLNCQNNLLTTLDTSSLNDLASFYCSNNLFTDLDCNNNHKLSEIDFSNNPNLNMVFVKNGSEEFNQDDFLQLNCPNLRFMCADDFQVTSLIRNLAPTVNINTYCSLTPGGSYNTITGTLTFDANNNGCDANDIFKPNMRVNINEALASGASFTNTAGNYTFYTQVGSFTIMSGIENPAWFTISPSSVIIPFSDNNNNTVTQNFCITANGIHPDLEIIIIPITLARPGFTADYKIVYRNKGNQTISQTNDGISFFYDYTRMNLLSTSEPVSLITAPSGTLNWDLNNLSPFESRSILLTFQINSPVSTLPVNIGDILSFNAVVKPIIGDETSSDNTFHYNQTVVGSFDPNDITCIEGNMLPPSEIGNYLHYIINFENTGTAEAENIVVKEIINSDQFDISSLQVLNSSAILRTKVTGNLAEFIFQNINLHSGGHGNILIKIKSKNTLTEGDTVSKKANIYFDYNFPVETLPADTVFQTLSNPEVPVDASITLYPNPTKGIVNVDCNNTIQSIQLYDIQGRLLQTNLINQNQAVIDISTQSNGIYFLKVVSDKGILVQKIVRE